jgi:hypothetical protein
VAGDNLFPPAAPGSRSQLFFSRIPGAGNPLRAGLRVLAGFGAGFNMRLQSRFVLGVHLMLCEISAQMCTEKNPASGKFVSVNILSTFAFKFMINQLIF